MSNTSTTALKVVFGAMTFGKEGTLAARTYDTPTAGKILDIFQAHGHQEIDTARIYGNGSSEAMLAELEWKKRGLTMETKLYPTASSALTATQDGYTHSPADIRRGLMDSLKALDTDKIDMFYLHGPDRQSGTSYETTLSEVDKLHKEGYFTRFGISNYQSWEVAQMCELCIKHNWIKPTVYQGVYNTLQRTIEAELFPCLRYYGISLYAFQPLAGGFLTGRYTRDQQTFEPGSRFDPKILIGKMSQGRYWNESYFDALDIITAAGEKHGLTVAEIALRWEEHHSLMKREFGDAIIVGASSVKHLEENLEDLENGPLPEDVVEALDQAWARVKGVAPKYWH